eukprot:gnl/TRDRNA2_/TRDRNA2_176289_c0_seq1.p1 gnl/TRDRNA2_/TRDRNA2_176289_c0~~gnl/TRDRNA2_/TRDRNA2_176289_c0_seq1.p1  ORF type:complete len:253 (+),score=35.04 gnl/TRDRNA2_/TRDRNA2_176289_c0_seq1:424-1182(+)
MDFLAAASARGWRSCVFNRRGASEPLASPNFNIIGNTEDTCRQVEVVQQRYPRAFLTMVGISAGSGLIVTYLGTSGAQTPIRAACSLCPAYDLSSALQNVKILHPWADQFLLRSMKQKFIYPNLAVLKDHDAAAVDRCLKASSLYDFMLAHIPFTGARDADEYFKLNNPMEHVPGVSVLGLLLNADDDVVCLPENIREDVARDCAGSILVRTAHGTHCAYCEGRWGEGSYMNRLALDFLEAARQIWENHSKN